MNILLTGSKGFIGKRLKIALTSINHVVAEFNEEDLADPAWRENLRKLVTYSDAILHVGAISSTDASDVNRVMLCNYEFTKELFDAAAVLNTPVVYSSSAAIYGQEGLPMNLYAWTKKLGEDYGLLKLNKFIALRYFNVYGPTEFHKGSMASVACQAYVFKQQHPHSHFKLFPGKPTRDFVYIIDVVMANIHALYLLKNDFKTGVYDVGSGESSTFEDVLDLVGVKYKYHPESSIPPWYQYKTLANKDLFLPNWKPEFNLVKGMEDYLRFLHSA